MRVKEQLIPQKCTKMREKFVGRNGRNEEFGLENAQIRLKKDKN
jgi:hypothetical protein